MAEDLVRQLTKAAEAYYETGTPIMTDDKYDDLRDKLEAIQPDHPFLKTVGAVVRSGAVVSLPVPMPSLNKIKPGTGAVANFVRQTRSSTGEDSWVLSEKLDGISALWIPAERKLYLRGNGLVGQDVSHLIGLGIQGLPVKLEKGLRVRGELLIRKADVPPNTIGRSLVNGILHQTDADPAEVKKIRFLGYEISSGKEMGTREEQMDRLKKMRYEVPWWTVVSPTLDEDILEKALKGRREKSEYDIDGIVVGENSVPEWHSWTEKGGALRNPKDQVAFKMVLSDQCAETKVVAVLWGLSYQGYYIPRLEIEPVRVGGAIISYVTAHNARNVVEKGIGIGARIRIRRSGDVIPTIDAILVPVKPSMPPEGTWEWCEGGSVHICATKTADSSELKESRLRHFASTLEIDGLGPGLVKKMVVAGVDTPKKLVAATSEALSAIVGKKTGVSIAEGLRKALESITEKQLMIASGSMPRGVGETKLDALLRVEPDPRKWSTTMGRIEGWSKESLEAFLAAYSQYETWRKSEFPGIPYPILGTRVTAMPVTAMPVAMMATAAPAPGPTVQKGLVCFTGFRDVALEKKLIAAGYGIADTVTKKTTVLVIPDAGSESGKVEKARAAGIPIRKLSEFLQEYKL